MLRRINAIADRASKLAMTVAEIAIALMMMHVVIEIASRRLFRVSLDSVPEIVAFYYMSALIFLSLAYVTRQDGHVSASLFTDLMRPRTAEIIQALGFVVLCGAMLVVAWQTGTEAMRMTRIGEMHQGASFNLPKWPTRWFAPVGSVLMALTALLMAIELLTRRADRAAQGNATGSAD